LALCCASSAAANWSQLTEFGHLPQNGQLRYPRGMTLDGGGNFLVADTLNNRIEKFNSSGTFVSQFGSYGTGNGQFHQPWDVAVDGSGNIYVADSYNDRIQKFDSNGSYLGKFGSSGSGNGSFNRPRGIALDSSGNIYVSDTYNNRIQKFNSGFAFQAKVGSSGTTLGKFNEPLGIAIKSDGSVWVADSGNDRIQKFSAALSALQQFGSSANFAVVSDVKFDASNNIYVSDGWNGRVQKWSSGVSPSHISDFGDWGFAAGTNTQTSAVEVDSSGNVFALDAASDKISKYNASGTYQFRFATAGSGDVSYPTQMARAADGTVYMVDAADERVTHFSTSGAVLHMWGSHGTGNGQFSGPYGIAIAPNGNVYVSDAGNDRIQVFDSTGSYLAKFGSSGSGISQLDEPEGMTFDASGNLVVAECRNDRVHTFTQAGAHVSMFGTNGTTDGKLDCAIDVAVAADGSIWVVDENNDRVQEFDSTGTYQSQFGSSGSGAQQFIDPSGIGIAPNGDILVSDFNIEKVNRYDSNGAYQETIGQQVQDMETSGWFGGGVDVVPMASNAFWMPEVGDNRVSLWSDGPPNSTPNTPAALVQKRPNGSTIAIGSATIGTSATMHFDVSDADVSQTLTPWIEIRPIATPLSAICGASITGVTYSGSNVSATTGGTTYDASVTATGLTAGASYHWRACALDQTGTPSAWVSMGGTDGTTDLSAPGWGYQSQVGPIGANGAFQYPKGMTIDDSGNIWVADTLNDRVQKFNSAGVFQMQIGSAGSGDGELHAPTDVAVDGTGNVWVVDSLNKRVQKFSAVGAYVSQFGVAGSSPGEFSDPFGIAIGGGGALYVTDRNRDRILKFTSAGAYMEEYGTSGSGDGQLSGPHGIAIKSNGMIYVADAWNHRIQRFTAAGAYSAKIGGPTWDDADGQFNNPVDVRVDAAGNVFVADTGNARLQKFNSTHTWQWTKSQWGYRNGDVIDPYAVDVDASGNIFSLDALNDRVNKYDSSGTFVSSFGNTGAGQLEFPTQIARAPDGTLYTIDPGTYRVTHFATSGAVLHTWGSAGSSNSQFDGPLSIAVGPDGSVYVGDTDNHRIQKFTAAGVYITQWNTGERLYGLTVTQDNTVYVADRNNDRIQIFDSVGTPIDTFGTSGSGDGEIDGPVDVAVDEDGAIYVIDANNLRVEKFDSSYDYVTQFGTAGTGDGEFMDPNGISIAPGGDVFVADVQNHNVSRFSADGVFKENFGGRVDDGETSGFYLAADVVMTADNAGWIADQGNNRISYWTSGPPMTPPNPPGNLAQHKLDGVTSVATGGWTNQALIFLKFDVSDSDGTSSIIPWVEVRPTDVAFSANCGESVPGATYSVGSVNAVLPDTYYSTLDIGAGMLTDGEYHWRACGVDNDGNMSAWSNYDGTDGTRDFGVDTQAPTTLLSDGAGADIDVQGSTTVLNANWVADDGVGSGVLNFDWCFTSNNINNCAVSGRISQASAAAGSSASATGITPALTPGAKYYFCLRARDVLNNVGAYTCSDGVQVSSGSMTVSGTALRDEYGTVWQGCDGVTQNVTLSVDGAAPTSTTCSRTTGTYSFTTPFAAPVTGHPLVLYLNSSSAKGVTYYVVAGGGAATGVDIVQDRVTMRSQAAKATVNDGTFQAWDGTDTGGRIPIDGATSTDEFALDSMTELHLAPGITFDSGDHNISTGSIHVSSGATFIPTSDWEQSNFTGYGTSSVCADGPGAAAPMCVDPGGDVTNYVQGNLLAYFSPTIDMPVGIDNRVPYWDDLVLDYGVDGVLGVTAAPTMINAGYFQVRDDATLNSDLWDLDVTAHNTVVDGRWTGDGSMTLTSACAFTGEGMVRTPGLDVTLTEYDPQCTTGPNYSRSDWVVHSMLLNSDRTGQQFGSGGAVSFNSSGSNLDTPGALATDQDNNWTYLLTTSPGSGTDWWIMRYWTIDDGTHAAGALDTTWGASGRLQINLAGSDVGTVAMIDSRDDQLIVGGSMSGTWQLRKYTHGATLDSDFDGDGIWDAATESITGTPRALMQTDNGEIWVAGDDTSSTTKWQVRRIADTGGAALTSLTWNGDTGSGASTANVKGICATTTDWGSQDNVWVVGAVGTVGARDWAIGHAHNTAGAWAWQPMLDASARPGKVTSAGTADEATTCSTWSGDDVYVGGTRGNANSTDLGRIVRYEDTDGDGDWEQNDWWGNNYDGSSTIDTPGVRDYLTKIWTEEYMFNVVGGDSANGGRTVMHQLDADGFANRQFNDGVGYVAYDPSAGDDHGVDMTASRGGDYIQILTPSATNGGNADVFQIDTNGMLQSTSSSGFARFNFPAFDRSRIHVLGDLTIGDGAGVTTNVADLDRGQGAIDVDGDLIVNSDGVLRTADNDTMRVGGDVDVNGPLFAGRDSIIDIRPRSSAVSLNVLPTTTFEGLKITGTHGGAAVNMDRDDPITVSDTFEATGTSCAEPLKIRPLGATWILDTTDGGVSGTNLDLLGATFVPGDAVMDSFDSGLNSGVTFAGTSCGSSSASPPDTMRTNGILHAQNTTDAPAPTFSFTNRAYQSTDTADTTVYSSSPEDVLGLWRFDGDWSDSSGNGNSLTETPGCPAMPHAPVAGCNSTFDTGAYSQAADVPSNNNPLFTPVIPTGHEVTVDGWFKRGPLTGSDSAYPGLVYKGSGDGTHRSYAIVFDRDANTIQGSATYSGGNFAGAETSATRYTDNQWHHVALTASSGNVLTLYLDGEPVGHDTLWGDIDDDVNWWTGFADHLNGVQDDWQLRSVAMNPEEVRGYYRTARRHMDTVWSQTNATIGTTTYGSAATTTYAGVAGSLAHDGARYWVRQRQKQMISGLWTPWSIADWFQTSIGSMTVSLPGGSSANMGPVAPGQDVQVAFDVDVATDNEDGWSLFARGESDTYALSDGLSGPTNQIARRTTPTWLGLVSGFGGITVLSAPGGKATGTWGSGTTGSDYANLLYTWPMATQPTMIHSYASSVVTQTVQLSARVNPALTTAARVMSGRLDFTAVPNV
jgi:hypothetical protein